MKKTIRQLLLDVGFGIGRVMVISPGRSYSLPGEKPFRIDSVNLRADANKVAYALRQQFRK